MGRYTGLTAKRGLHLLLREAAAADAKEHAGSCLVDLVRERLPSGRRIEALHRSRVLLCRSLLRLLCRRRLQALLPVYMQPKSCTQHRTYPSRSASSHATQGTLTPEQNCDTQTSSGCYPV